MAAVQQWADGTVVLACHHQLLSAGIEHTLGTAGWAVTGTAGDALGVRRLVVQRRPDVCLVLVPFPEGAADLVEELTALQPRPRVVCLSTDDAFEDHETVLRVFAAGADGWLTLDLPPEVLGRTLDAVRAGEAALSRRHVRSLLHGLRSRRDGRVALADGRSLALTPREAEILEALRQGTPTKVVAATLGVSPATVRWHVSALLGKAGVATRAELLAAVRG